MSLLFKFRPLVINPELAERIGLNEAIVLQQLNYWITETEAGVEHDGRRWVYNTLEQWQKQFPFWSVDTIKRTLSSLQKHGIVAVEQLNKSKHDRTNFYTINHLASALFDEGNLHPSEEGNLPPSSEAGCPDLLTENTTETTQESTQQSLSTLAKEIFDHWRWAMKSPRSKMDDKRKNLILKALKLYSADELKKAIDGCALSPFHMGANDRKEKYNGLDLIFRSAEKIDGFIAKAERPPVAPKVSGISQDFQSKTYQGTSNEQFADAFQ